MATEREMSTPPTLRIDFTLPYCRWCTTIFMARRRGIQEVIQPVAELAPLTAVCIVIRSCGASNTTFIAWRQSLCGCWTTRMEQFTWVRHRLLVTSHLQEISQDLFIFNLYLFSLYFRAQIRGLITKKHLMTACMIISSFYYKFIVSSRLTGTL